MTRPDTLPRWLESDAPDALSDGLATYAQQGPSDEALERMWAGVEQAVQPGATATSGDPPTELGTATHWTTVKLWLLGGTLLSGVALGFVWMQHDSWSTRAPTVPPPAAPDPAPPPKPTEPAPAAAAPSVAAMPHGQVLEGPDPRPAPHAKAKAPRARGARGLQHEKTPATQQVDPAAELTLLQRARRHLRGSPARALTLLAEHRRRFPRGMFVQEREVLAIEALLADGDREAASERARRFRSAHRGSAHIRRVEQLLASPSP